MSQSSCLGANRTKVRDVAAEGRQTRQRWMIQCAEHKVLYIGIFLVSILRKHALIKFQRIINNFSGRNKFYRPYLSSGSPNKSES